MLTLAKFALLDTFNDPVVIVPLAVMFAPIILAVVTILPVAETLTTDVFPITLRSLFKLA